MTDVKWRFPAAGYGKVRGISTGDSETFKKSPYQAFAREILQNSIDARASDEEPTRVEFSTFKIKRNDIPGFYELVAQINRCFEYWSSKPDYQETYQKILSYLKNDTINCLRVSDFNTTGLIGVDTNELKGNKFLALTKGTGLSEKSGKLSGGSKGVGKNAAFLMSKIKTVFYSTNANQDTSGNTVSHLGYMGVTDLISGWLDDEHKNPGDDCTQGTGYYSSNDLNNPTSGVLNLDPSSQDRKTNNGTDIYILGFEPEQEWIQDIVCSILDSFMVAIYRNELSVLVDNVEISRETIKEIVFGDQFISEKMRSNIVSQYMLLTDGDRVISYDINTDYGSCELFVLPLKKNEDEYATHKCAMIRHPLMKIKDIQLSTSLSVSAMCIINPGKIGEMLKNIENPQHIDWEPNRVDDPSERKEYKNLLKQITGQIKDKVIECLQINNEAQLDPNGAGDFLPDTEVRESSSDGNGNDKPQETVSVSKPKENIAIEKNANISQDDGNGLEPDIGDEQDGDNEEVSYPEGHNDEDGGEERPGENTGDKSEGDSVIFKRVKLAGVRYKVISTDKKNGKMRIVFIAPIDYPKCYLSISMLDDNNSPSPIEILSLSKNGNAIACDNHKEYGPFEISANQKIILDISTNTKEYFGSEVKVICK